MVWRFAYSAGSQEGRKEIMDYSQYADTIVTISDFRSCHYCVKGVKYGFDRYDLDFADFLENGISGEILLTKSNGDALVMLVVEAAHGRR